MGTALVVQGLRLHPPNAGGLGSIPGQETRFHMPQLRPGAAKSIGNDLKIASGICLTTDEVLPRQLLSALETLQFFPDIGSRGICASPSNNSFASKANALLNSIP